MGAHPTRKFMSVEVEGQHRLIPCYWYKSPRPPDLEGSHPYYDDPNKVTLRFWQHLIPEYDHIDRAVVQEHNKVILETWTAPDCIFEKRQLGYWASYGLCVLHNVTPVSVTRRKENDWLYMDVEYKYERYENIDKTEEIQLSVDHIPDDDHKDWFKLRPRISAYDIIKFREEVNLIL